MVLTICVLRFIVLMRHIIMDQVTLYNDGVQQIRPREHTVRYGIPKLDSSKYEQMAE